MRFDEFKLFKSVGGTFAVHPEAAVAVSKSADGAEIYLANGKRFIVSDDARDVAQQLWGYLNETENGFFNAQHVLAIRALSSGCLLLFTGGLTLDAYVSVEEMMQILQKLEQHRKSMLDVSKGTGL